MTTTAKTGRRERIRFAKFADVPESYRELCALHLPRPVHTAAEAAAATAIVEALAGFPLNEDQSDYLEAVAHFLDEHDRARLPKSRPPAPRDILASLMEERGLTAADLSRILGASRNVGGMLLRGDRRLTLDHIGTLSRHFGVNPAVFVAADML